MHSQHVISALESRFNTVDLLRPIAVPTWISTSPVLPGTLRDLAQKRTQPAVGRGTKTHFLGMQQFAHPIANRLPSASRWVPDPRSTTELSATKVAKYAAKTDYFQFVEGLGHKTLIARRRSSQIAVMERRNLHHRVFENPRPVFAGFPVEPYLDPIRDMLDIEYAEADIVVTYSEVARVSIAEAIRQPHKVVTIPLPVCVPARASVTHVDPHRLLFVGRVNVDKGADVLLAALRLLPRQYTLTVAGPATTVVRELLVREPRVNYVGLASRDRLNALYSTHSIFVMPSVESFGLAIIEAASYGMHLVVASTSGVADRIDPRLRSTIARMDPHHLADVIVSQQEACSENKHISGRTALDGLMTWASVDNIEKQYDALLCNGI